MQMMDIFIHKKILGFQQHLRVSQSGKIQKTPFLPSGLNLVYGTEELVEIGKIYNKEMPLFPSKATQRPLETVLNTRSIEGVPWLLTMPPKKFKSEVEALAQQLVSTFGSINLDYYQNYYLPTVELLNQMQPMKIDPRAWMLHKNNPDLVSPHVFKTFEPDSTGYAAKTRYSKSDTVTGRLKVISGANILHLPKEQRNIIASRFGSEGRVMQLDFKALEPRTILFVKRFLPLLSGNVPLMKYSPIKEDIYQDVLDSLGIKNIPRDKVKDVILTQLYGGGYDRIIGSLSGISDPEGFISAVNDYFGLDQIREQLITEYERNNREYITSFYGRPLNTKEAKLYMLLSYFNQSTAVEIALQGFKNVVNEIKTHLIVPLGILHDALILDTHLSKIKELEELKELGTKNIPKFPNCEFAIKLSRF